MQTNNPTLLSTAFRKERISLVAEMSISGVVNKALFLLMLITVSACWTWYQFYTTDNPQIIVYYLLIGAIVGLIVGIITVFSPQWAFLLAPIYALLEGLVIGGISTIFEAAFPGIVIQAVALTFGTLFSLLFFYKIGLIKVTRTFMIIVIAATGAIALIYLIDIGLMFFGIRLPYIHESGIVGIAFSLVVVIVAALNLVLDFEFIKKAAEAGAPKYMEWYSAFALIVTLVWLYLEMLQLLAKIRNN